MYEKTWLCSCTSTAPFSVPMASHILRVQANTYIMSTHNTYTLKISLCSYHVTLHLQPRYIKTVDTSNCGPLTAHSCVSLSSKTLSCHNFMFRCMDKPSCISIFHILNTLSMTFTWNGLQPIFVKINMNDTLIWGPGAMVFQKTFLPVLLYRAMNNQLGKCPSLE